MAHVSNPSCCRVGTRAGNARGDCGCSLASRACCSGSALAATFADTVDIDLTLATDTLSGSHDGVTNVVFTTTHYVVDDMAVAFAGTGLLFGLGLIALADARRR